MSDQGWDRNSVTVRDRERDRLLVEWLDEIRAFCPYWDQRLGSERIRGASDLRFVSPAEEAEVVRAGGPGNPALLVLPTEDGFKQRASVADLLSAARELRGGGTQARRAAMFRRYKPVHVHAAGVGGPLAVAYTRTDLDRLHLSGARLIQILGLSAEDSLISLVPAGPHLAFWGLYHAALAARMTAVHPRGVGEGPLGPLAKSIELLPATVLAIPVDEAVKVVSTMAKGGAQLPTLRTILTVGPPPPTAVREQIAAAAQQLGAEEVRIQAVWAPPAARALWGECRPTTADPSVATYGLHTYPDLELLSVRDIGSEAAAAPGEPGELLYTSLGWRGTVLIRFATGAWSAGLVTDVACPSCGRTVPRLAPQAVEAAWQPRVRVADGELVTVDLRRAPAILRPALARLEARDWSLRSVEQRLVLGLDLPSRDQQGASDLALSLGHAVGVVPQVSLDPAVAAARPQLGAAGLAR